MSYYSASRNKNDFVASMQKYGLSRPNRYDIQISHPVSQQSENNPRTFSSFGLSGTRPSKFTYKSGNEGDELVAIRCESIELPGKATRSVAEENIYGPQYEIPQGLTYSNQISASFVLDRQMFIKRYFDAWQDNIQSTNFFDMNFYENYIRDMVIRQLDEQDNPVYACKVFEVYPSSVESISLSNTARSEFSRLNVTFAFRFWKETTVDLENNNQINPTPKPLDVIDPISGELKIEKEPVSRIDPIDSSLTEDMKLEKRQIDLEDHIGSVKTGMRNKDGAMFSRGGTRGYLKDDIRIVKEQVDRADHIDKSLRKDLRVQKVEVDRADHITRSLRTDMEAEHKEKLKTGRSVVDRVDIILEEGQGSTELAATRRRNQELNRFD